MKSKVQAGMTVLFLLATAILLTIYLAWLAYPLEIQWLGLEKVVYLESTSILHNFNILMNYLTNPFQLTLSMPNFRSSFSGLYHFEQVKFLFHFTQGIFLLTLPAVIGFMRDVVLKGYALLFRKTFLWAAAVPVLVGFAGVVIGFDAFFTLFHQVLFPGDSTWLFDPNADPVIYILPQEFFLHCFILFFALYEGLFLGMVGFMKKISKVRT